MANESLISAAGIIKKFGSLTAVDDVSMEVYPGEICGVAGLNGAGKSTLLAILAGVMRPDGGAVAYRGKQVNAGKTRPAGAGRGSSRLLRIGYVPQETALFPDLSVYDNLKFWALANSGSPKSRDADTPGHRAPLKDRILSAADATGLSEKINKPVRSLSGGMKQRANIAAALVAEPEVLIMDEPTAGLDVKNRRDIINFVNALVRRATGGLAVICTSHQPGELEAISDRFLLLDRGKVVYNGLPREIFKGKYASYENIDDILYSLSGGA